MSNPRVSFAPAPVPDPAPSAGSTSGTAVLLDASVAAPPRRTLEPVGRTFRPAPDPGAELDGDDAPPSAASTGFVVVELAGDRFAVSVDEVHEILRRPRLHAVPGGATSAGEVALVDVRGRTIPVLDARRDRSAERPAHVLLPVYRHQVGLVVDRVVGISADLEPEPEGPAAALPSTALGVLRAPGGDPVVLLALPAVADVAPGRG